MRARASNLKWLSAAAGLAIALLIVGSFPFLFGWVTVPSDKVYTGLMFDVPDHAQYWSWVTASRQGLFIANTMTPEPNLPVFMNPMMWLLAQIQSLTGCSLAALMQVWRVLAVLVLSSSLAYSFFILVADPPIRRTATWVAVVSAGFGWVLVVLKYIFNRPDFVWPMDVYIVEANTFFASFAYPYLALAQGLVLVTLAGAWLAYREGRPGAYAVAALGSIALALSHAYDLITVYAVLAAFWLRETVKLRRVPLRLTAVGLVVGLCSGPIVLYYRNLTANDPLWQSILAQYANAGVWTPPHVHLVILMGLPLLLAAAAIPCAWRADDERGFLATWAIVGLGLIYLPTVFQIKLLTGWQFPLAILAAHTWHRTVTPRLERWLGSARWRLGRTDLVATAVLIALVVPTNLYLYAWRFIDLRRYENPYFLHHDEMAALEWLVASSGPDDVVLAPIELGQFVPNYGNTRSYLAHWAMTNRFFERREAVARFFAPDTSETERAAILERDRVTLVLRPSPPPGEAAYDPAGSALFEPVFTRPAASVFRYRARTGEAAPGMP